MHTRSPFHTSRTGRAMAAAVILLTAIAAGAVRMHAQPTFPATHAASIFLTDSLRPFLEGEGLAYMNVDAAAEVVQLRLTLVTPGDTVTDVLIRRTNANGKPGDTLTAIPYPEGITTVTTDLQIANKRVYEVLDSNLITLDLRSKHHPGGYMLGRISFVPNGIVFEMSGRQEVPSVDSVNAEGHLLLQVDRAAHKAHYVLSWEGLSSPATAAQVHKGAPGENGPSVFTMPLSPGHDGAVGDWIEMSDDDIDALAKGKLYVNIHTELHPDGEIRGRLLPTEVYAVALDPLNEVPPVTTSDASGTALATLYLVDGEGGGISISGVFGDMTSNALESEVALGAPGQDGLRLFTVRSDSAHIIDWEHNVGPTDIDATHLAAIRAGNTYLNVATTDHIRGEIRGQLIPSLTNLTTSGVAISGRAGESTGLSGRVIDGGAMLRFTLDDALAATPVHGVRRIRLYSALGTLVADQEMRGSTASIVTAGLPAGPYFAEVAGMGRARCSVMLVR